MQTPAGLSLRLMNPGPAISTLTTRGSSLRSADDQFGERARIHARFLGQHHGGVGGEIAMRGSRGGSTTTRLASSPARDLARLGQTARAHPPHVSQTARKCSWFSISIGPPALESFGAPNASPALRQTSAGVRGSHSGPSCRRCNRPPGGRGGASSSRRQVGLPFHRHGLGLGA